MPDPTTSSPSAPAGSPGEFGDGLSADDVRVAVLLRDADTISRGELAKRSGLSRATIAARLEIQKLTPAPERTQITNVQLSQQKIYSRK